MKLLSHGAGSNLLAHVWETAVHAENLTARTVFLCHDIGKATRPWQAYIAAGGHSNSPHPHAAAGGLLAAALLRRAGAAPVEILAALHCNAAHHSDLAILDPVLMNQIMLIASDSQAKAFFLDRKEGIASLLPEYSDDLLENAWSDFQKWTNSLSPERLDFAHQLALIPDEGRLAALLKSRTWLGELCFNDRYSAKKQSGKITALPDYQTFFAAPTFQRRPPKTMPSGKRKIFELRTQLREKFLTLTSNSNSVFTFLDAPTGMGKTEAMLQAAELMRDSSGARRIIFAVPQVSIADQIYEDYFLKFNAKSVQIWNYRRKEAAKTKEENAKEKTEAENTGDSNLMLAESHPFACSYNITTFNQVLLSMFHPNRDRCIRSAGLRNSIIIMDEFHKLPLNVLPLFFSAAKAFAEQFNCRFIFGSATPFELLPYWGTENSAHLERENTAALYCAPEIDNRRVYTSAGSLPLESLIQRMEEFHQENPKENLLVVVNLVKQASWPLRKHFFQTYHPWRELEQNEFNGRKIFLLDGLTPPVLRREIILQCRDAMQKGPVTLISTQMVEVGVDLDFDSALIDYQGLASVIQRGGRTGREGRTNGEPCNVSVFSLLTDEEKTSFEVLIDAMQSSASSFAGDILQEINENSKDFMIRELRFFRKWAPEQVFHDHDLTDKLCGIQKKVFGKKTLNCIWERLFPIFPEVPDRLGAPFEFAHFLAEFSGPDYGKDIILVPNKNIENRLTELDKKISQNQSTPDERAEYTRLLADYHISYNPALQSELALPGPCALLKNPDPIPLCCLESGII